MMRMPSKMAPVRPDGVELDAAVRIVVEIPRGGYVPEIDVEMNPSQEDAEAEMEVEGPVVHVDPPGPVVPGTNEPHVDRRPVTDDDPAGAANDRAIVSADDTVTAVASGDMTALAVVANLDLTAMVTDLPPLGSTILTVHDLGSLLAGFGGGGARSDPHLEGNAQNPGQKDGPQSGVSRFHGGPPRG
jgi:hypothetical protein